MSFDHQFMCGYPYQSFKINAKIQKYFGICNTSRPSISDFANFGTDFVYFGTKIVNFATHTHFLRVDGVKQPVAFYTLDVIISVGYRVKSKRGTSFRQWANQVLKDYLLKGYSVNKSLQEVKTQLGTQDKRISLLEDKVDFFVRSSLPPVEGIFYDGQIFDAYAQIINLIKQAKRSIVLIDNYIRTDTPHFLCPYDNILPNSTPFVAYSPYRRNN